MKKQNKNKLTVSLTEKLKKLNTHYSLLPLCERMDILIFVNSCYLVCEKINRCVLKILSNFFSNLNFIKNQVHNSITNKKVGNYRGSLTIESSISGILARTRIFLESLQIKNSSINVILARKITLIDVNQGPTVPKYQ